MKKKKLLLLSILGIFTISLLLFQPPTVSGTGKHSPAGPSTAIPDSILAVFQKSCMDCHSDDGSALARGKVNFSIWETYDISKKVKKGADICEELTKATMPPKGWRKNNPDDVPTQAEVNKVCSWVESLKK